MTTIYPCHSAARELGRRRLLQFSDHHDGCSERFGRKVFEVRACSDIPTRKPDRRPKIWSQLLQISSSRGRRRLSVAAGLGHCEVGHMGRTEFEAEHRQGSCSRIGKDFGQKDFSKIGYFDQVALYIDALQLGL